MEKKIAIIADIHGNRAALAAVLGDIERAPEIEQIYCLGDLIGIGYETNEVLEILCSRRNLSFVMGNHDEAILDIISGREPYSRGKERDHHKWIASQLDRKFIPFLAEIPSELQTIFHGKRLQLVHYHLNENGNFIEVDYEPSEEKLDKHYHASTADIVCFGHHHVVHYFKSSKRLYLNPSSLGCYHKPLAVYAILTIGKNGSVTVTLKEVPYDNKAFLLGYKELNVPDADYILKTFHGNQHLQYM